jgi:hypothetical protein
MQDPTFRGLSDLWTRFDRGNSTLGCITNPADNDGSKSPAKSLDKKKKKDPQEPTLLDKAREAEQEALKSLINVSKQSHQVRERKYLVYHQLLGLKNYGNWFLLPDQF